MPKITHTEEQLYVQNSGEDQIHDQMSLLIQKYGDDALKEHIATFANLLGMITHLNNTLAKLDADADKQRYTETVSHIIHVTQDYYAYIGKLPEDLRRFFLALASGNSANDGSIEELNALLDVNLPTNASLMPAVQSIRPKNYIMQIDAITNQLANLGGQNKLKVGARGNQPIKTTVTLDIPEHMRIEGGVVLSTYDKSIINGVTSLLESGNPAFSVPMLYHAITGKQNPTVDEQLYEELTAKLEMMRRLMLTIDLTEESRARFITDENGDPLDIEELTIEGYLLPLNKMTGLINGKRTELYQLIQNPPLYTYSKLRRQLASVPIQLLNAPVNNNSTTIPLKTYLLQRVEMMKNEKNTIKSNTILYETVYAELGLQDANKTRKMRIRNYTTTILDYYIEKGYISGYVEFKKGRAVAGVKIMLQGLSKTSSIE